MPDADDPRASGRAAGGLSAIVSTLRSATKMGAKHGLQALSRVNQPGGFDCPGCAWPEAREHGPIEFCENGAKALAHAGTRRRVTRAWLARTSLAELLGSRTTTASATASSA